MHLFPGRAFPTESWKRMKNPRQPAPSSRARTLCHIYQRRCRTPGKCGDVIIWMCSPAKMGLDPRFGEENRRASAVSVMTSHPPFYSIK